MHIRDEIDHELDQMIALVTKWASINSHSHNLLGIKTMIEEASHAFQALEPDEIRVIPLNQNPGLFLQKKMKAPIQIYFGGHLDTVFSIESPFQKVSRKDQRTLIGPGVTDMKGGLVVLLKALEQFERTEAASKVGWRIFLNSDEEIGSIYSRPFIESCSFGCKLACLFEPTLPDGSLVCSRKGSMNFSAYSKGKRAHVGRDPQEGKNAIYPLSKFIVEVEQLQDKSLGTLINVGLIQGGEGSNIVPAHAECHLNVRADLQATLESIEAEIQSLATKFGVELQKKSDRPPKQLDAKTENLMQILAHCGSRLGQEIKWAKTGGVCDGNIIAAKGIPTLDTLGVLGGKIHTENEYLVTSSLKEKTLLTALFLSEVAACIS